VPVLPLHVPESVGSWTSRPAPRPACPELILVSDAKRFDLTASIDAQAD